jgi:tripartite-type tricarboxylate transporter receptor subunit TctC
MGKKIIMSLLLTSVLLSLVISSCSKTEYASSASEFYKGKTINMVVSGDAGSIADLVSRVVANRLSADTQANIIVNNRSEAGGLDGTNYLAKANPDGLNLGAISMVKLLSAKILNDPAALYKIEDFHYLLNVNKSQTYFYVSSTARYQSVSDLKAGTALKIAAGSASGAISLAGLTVIDLLDLDARLITGFENNSARSLATQRGEVTGYATSLAGLTGGELEKGTLKPLFVIATQRDSIRPDVPAITELVNLSEDDLALVKLWENGLSSGVVITAPARIAKEKILYLDNLADEWYQDEKFCQEINKVSGYEVKIYTSGQLLTDSIKDIASKLESFQSRFADMIKKYRT